MPRVGDIYQLLTCNPKTINENASQQEVIEAMLSGSPLARSVYAVDDAGHLKGIITLNNIMQGIAIQKGLAIRDIDFKSPFKLLRYTPFALARDIMGTPIYVTRDTKLQDALEKMVSELINELPVVDGDGKIIGDLNAFELLKFVEPV